MWIYHNLKSHLYIQNVFNVFQSLYLKYKKDVILKYKQKCSFFVKRRKICFLLENLDFLMIYYQFVDEYHKKDDRI